MLCSVRRPCVHRLSCWRPSRGRIRSSIAFVFLAWLTTSSEALAPLKATAIFGKPAETPGYRIKGDHTILDVWVGFASHASATVDGRRGFQKCCRVLGCVIYGEVESRFSEDE